MNWKRFLFAVIAVFGAFQVMDYIVHYVILGPVYQVTAQLWRPEMMSMMWIMVLTGLFLSFMFVYVFTKGYEEKGISEGIRYGLIIGLFINVPYAFNQYVIFPLPFSLVVKWLGYGLAEFIIAGAVAAAVYRPADK